MQKHNANRSLIAVATILMLAIELPSSLGRNPKDDALTIIPGGGVKGCQIGASIEDAHKVFGKPSSKKDLYVDFDDRGFGTAIDDGKINAMFFYFRSRTKKQFSGSTDKGVGKDSSIEDVIKQYGIPGRTFKSVVSEFGEEPGAVDDTLSYSKLGVHFTFYDKKLAFIVVNGKRE